MLVNHGNGAESTMVKRLTILSASVCVKGILEKVDQPWRDCSKVLHFFLGSDCAGFQSTLARWSTKLVDKTLVIKHGHEKSQMLNEIVWWSCNGWFKHMFLKHYIKNILKARKKWKTQWCKPITSWLLDYTTLRNGHLKRFLTLLTWDVVSQSHQGQSHQ